MRRGHRRPRKSRRGGSSVSSVDRSIAHASTGSIVQTGLELGAGALAPFAIGELIETRQWLNTTIKDADWRRYSIAGGVFVLSLLAHPYAPSLGLAGMIGSGVYAFAPPLKKAVNTAALPAPAGTPQLPPTTPPTP